MLRVLLCATLLASASATAFAGEPLPANPEATRHCLDQSGCPETYAQLFPYLDRFCAGTLTDGDLDTVDALARDGALHKTAIEALLNVYGAMYGYEFKMLRQLNTFFYDPDAPLWLPPSCVPTIRSKPSASKMPFALTKQRDRIRAIFDKRFPKQP
ncbi:MAG: hypothetical protein U1F43_32825 [Myxococcota bacterium]